MTKRKKIIFGVLIMIAVLIAAVCGFFAVMSSPTDPDSFETKELEDGTLRITRYNGLPRFNFVFPSEINGKKVSEIGSCFLLKGQNFDRLIFSAEIPEGVTYLMGTFAGFDRLKSVKLPDSLKEIGDYSFRDCVSLSEISLPSELEKINSHAFGDCKSLERIDIPENLSSIGIYAFIGCISLNEAVIPENCSVGMYAFKDCTALENVTLPRNADYGDMTFSGTPFETKEPFFILNDTLQKCSAEGIITIPKNVSRIGIGAFSGCDISEAVIPGNVTEIADNAFANCKKLERITIPDSIGKIGKNIFWGCESLEQVTFPEGTEKIPDGCFIGCSSLTEFEYPESVTEIGEQAFFQSGLVSADIPDTVTVIGADAFNMCQKITSLTYPANISVDHGAFANCSSLKELSFEEGVSELPQYCFKNCTALTDIRLPDSIRLIDIGCFSGCTGLKYAELCISKDGYGDDMDYMAEEYTYSWFYGCDSLEYVLLSDKTEMADYRSLMAGTMLKGIYVPGTVKGYMSGSRKTNTDYYEKNPVTVYSEEDVSAALTYMKGTSYCKVSSREEAERLMGIVQQ